MDSPGGTRRLRFYVDGQQKLLTASVGTTWDGGGVGLFRDSGDTTTSIQWDDFICGYDADSDGTIGTVSSPDPGDYIYAAYDFDGDWHDIDFTHDDNGNLTGDGLLKYKYDAWNRLVGVWYNDGDVSESNEQVARYEYDGLFRRIEKQVTANQGEGVVHHSDDGDMTGILAGERHEHYFYSGWRLTETTNHVESGGSYSYDDSDVLNQFVYGTQYIDEPVRYDRNTDVGTDDDCLDADGSEAYFYHQDANWRVVMLTDEDAHVVERVEYTAYGEPTVYGGYKSDAAGELANALFTSTVGNPFMHQGLFRDAETRSYQNRFRQYDSLAGRFMQRDPLGYVDSMSLYGYLGSMPLLFIDPLGLVPPDPPDRYLEDQGEWLNNLRQKNPVAFIQEGMTRATVILIGALISLGAVDAAGAVATDGLSPDECPVPPPEPPVAPPDPEPYPLAPKPPPGNVPPHWFPPNEPFQPDAPPVPSSPPYEPGFPRNLPDPLQPTLPWWWPRFPPSLN